MTSKPSKSMPLLALLFAIAPNRAFAQQPPAVESSAPAPSADTPAPKASPSSANPGATQPAANSAAPADTSAAAAKAKDQSAEPALVSVFRRARSGESAATKDAEPGEANADDGAMGSHQTHFYGMLGYRLTRVSDDGYEPFAERPALHQMSLSVGRVLFARDAVSFALGLAWDYGGSESSARGAKTKLDAHRLTLLPEVRYHFVRRLYGFGRVGAGLGVVHAELSDAVTESTRTSDRLVFTMDASLGAALELIGEPAGASRRPRVWIALDGGYVFTTQTKTLLENESGVPARSEAHAFSDLNLGGLSGRLSAALTF